jgi:hypothetical protein
LITKKALLLDMYVGDVKKELKVVEIVKVEKGVKAENELELASIGKVGEISPWIHKKKSEMAKLLYVVGSEMEATRLELNSVHKEKEHLWTKMEHVKVVHESMTSMMEKEEKKL